ncbi:MAG: diguanylate cyclase, partial [Clostridia bacterium]|nr:diguanylate cyclase [Clostridia bacterium]
MNVSQIRKATLRSYPTSLFLFLILMVVSIAVFFLSIRSHVENVTRETVLSDVARQGAHIESMLDAQFRALEAFASLIAEGDAFAGEDNLRVIRHIGEKGDFKLVALFDPDGNAYYNNGMSKKIAGRGYHQEAMAGNRAISDPLESMVDGGTRVILAVPVVRDGETIGALGGSYDVSALSHMMFKGMYGDSGFALIVSADGKVVACESGTRQGRFSTNADFFDYCRTLSFTGADTAQTLIDSLSARQSGYVRFSDEGERLSYMAYEPMDTGSWMLCYIAPVEKVHEPYAFIERSEIALAAVLALGVVLMLLWLWGQNHTSQKQLIDYAQTDPLTLVSNKASTEERINAWLTGAQREGMQAFFMLDIDHFKTINDVYGHAAGDEVLRRVSRMIREEFRADDIVGRIGGDEFVIFMKNIPFERIAAIHAQTLCTKARQLDVLGLGKEKISLSVGIAYAPMHGDTYRQL